MSDEEFTICIDKFLEYEKTAFAANNLVAVLSWPTDSAVIGVEFHSHRTRLWGWMAIGFGPSGTPSITTSVIDILAYALMASILIKEILKAMGVISFFFHPYFHRPQNFAFIANSTLAFMPLLLSNRFRDKVLAVENDVAIKGSPWPLLWDLLLQDVPQLFLPILLAAVSPDPSPLVIFSLSGSVLSVVVGLARLSFGLKQEYINTLSTTGPDAQPQQRSSSKVFAALGPDSVGRRRRMIDSVVPGVVSPHPIEEIDAKLATLSQRLETQALLAESRIDDLQNELSDLRMRVVSLERARGNVSPAGTDEGLDATVSGPDSGAAAVV